MDDALWVDIASVVIAVIAAVISVAAATPRQRLGTGAGGAGS
jgi:hypothetical protein